MSYKEEIVELHEERKESFIVITKELISMYFHCFMMMPTNGKIRKKLLSIYKMFLNYFSNEGKILTFIKNNYGNETENARVEFILNNLDEMFSSFYDWYDDYMSELEFSLSMGDVSDLLYESIPLFYNDTKLMNDYNYLKLGLFKKNN